MEPPPEPAAGQAPNAKEQIMAARNAKQAALMERFGKRRGKRKHVADRTAERDTDTFLKSFHEKHQEMQARVEGADKVLKEDMDAFFKELQNELIDIQERLAKACGFLPSYHFEQLNIKAERLKDAIRARRDEVAPKKAFSFAAKRAARKARKPSAETKTEEKTEESEADALLAKLCESDCIKIENLSLKDKKLGVGEINGSDVVLSNLKNCKIVLTGKVGALRMNNIEHCTIISGPVAGSLFVEHIEHSTVHCALRQARIHYANFTNFYLHANSKPIVENSDNVKFAPYTVRYDGFEKQLQEADIDPNKNLWQEVQDFNWLRQQQSPHWSILPEGEREQEINIDLDEDEL